MNRDERAALLTAAQRAAASLHQSIAAKPAETPIETNVQSLGSLASVIDALVGDAARCGGIDCMGREIDGVRLWVTRDQFGAVQSRADRYEAALRRIADAVGDGYSELDMLVDWQGTAQELVKAARTALTETSTATA